MRQTELQYRNCIHILAWLCGWVTVCVCVDAKLKIADTHSKPLWKSHVCVLLTNLSWLFLLSVVKPLGFIKNINFSIHRMWSDGDRNLNFCACVCEFVPFGPIVGCELGFFWHIRCVFFGIVMVTDIYRWTLPAIIVSIIFSFLGHLNACIAYKAFLKG